MRFSVSNFSLKPVKKSEDFWTRVEQQLVTSGEAKLCLFPEYFSLSWLICVTQEKKFKKALYRCDETINEFTAKFKRLSKKYNKIIVAGTHPIKKNGKIINRCHIFFPTGQLLTQDKINMTRFEDEEWGVSGTKPLLTTFDINQKKVAVLICYDSEFSNLSLLLAKNKIDILLVPSCTDEEYGYWRVRHCSQARCIENQCFVLMASIVGGNKLFPDIDKHYGRACLLTPCDHGFSKRGQQLEAKTNLEMVVTGELDFKNLSRIRKSGTVLNLRDSVSIHIK